MRRTLLIATLCIQGFIIVSVGQIIKSAQRQETRLGCTVPVGMNTVQGIVFEDDNQNGIQDGLEATLTGITVELFVDADSNNIPDGAFQKSTTSDPSGEYHFDTTLVFSQDFIYDQRIQTGSDDANEKAAKGGDLDVELDKDDIKFGKSTPAGLRFTGLNIPSGATVNSSFMYLTRSNKADKGGKGDVSSVDVHAHDVANPATFTTTDSDISDRTMTSNSVQFDINWSNPGDIETSPDLSNVLQGLVDDYGAINNAAFILDPNGANEEVKAVSYEKNTSQAARLYVDYSAPGTGAYHFLAALDLPPGYVLTTTPTHQPAAFYVSDIADCNNNFGVYTGNKPPVAVDDSDVTSEDEAVVITVPLNDTDPNENLDPTSITIISAPTTGTAVYNAIPAGVLYTPDPGSYGRDTFSYQICDDGTPALCDIAEVVVLVNCSPDTNNISSTICAGNSVAVGASSYSTTGIHTTLIANEFCDSVVILDLTVDALPTMADAGINQSQCNNGNFTMAANTPAVGAGSWSLISGTATITNNTLPNTTVTGVPAGTSATIRWAITNGVCAVSISDVILQNGDLPTTANAGSDQTQCADGNFTITANTPAIGTGAWSLISGTATIANNTLPNITVTGVPAGTSATLRWTISSGSCTASTADVVLQNDAAPVANAGSGQNQCGDGTFMMAADNPAVGSGLWSVLSGFAAISDDTSPTTSVTGIVAGTSATLRWTVSNGVCSASTDDVTLNNDQQPAISAAGPDQTTCNTPAFTIAANTPLAGIGTWSIVSGSATIVSVVSPTTQVTGIASGASVTLRWTIANGVCAPSTDEITVTNSNCAPLAVADAATTTPGSTVAIDVLDNDSDPEGHQLTITIISTAPNQGGSAVINNNGTPGNPADDYIDFTPSGTYIGIETFEYNICDNGSPSECATTIATVSIQADSPVINTDAAVTDENVPVAINVVSNDTDGDGDMDVSTVVITQNPGSGSITNISPLGVVTYTPGLNFDGADLFKYRVSDIAGAQSNEATVNITVIENLPPVAVDDNVSTPESVAAVINAFANDSDPNGDLNVLSATIGGGLLQATHGTVVIIPGTGFQYTPDAGYSGFDQFEYQICDFSQFIPLCDVGLVTVFVSCPGTTGGNENEITGLVFFDQDSNTAYGPGEPGFEGSTVYLYADQDFNNIPDGPAIATTTTDANGVYSFDTVMAYSSSYTFDDRIQTGSDDASEWSGPTLNTNSNEVWVGDQSWVEEAGFRYTSVNIPAGVTIDDATLYLNPDKNGTTSVNIYAEDNVNPVTFTNANKVSTRTKTSAFEVFNINWTGGESNVATPDLASVIQEVVDNQGGVNDLVIIIGYNAGSNNEVEIKTFESSQAESPRLVINYSLSIDLPHRFIIEVETDALPATSVLTTSQYQYAAFYSPGTADCDNNFGFDITDLSPNIAPNAVNDSETNTSGDVLPIDVLTNDSDQPGQSLIITSISVLPDQGGNATINNNGTPFNYADDYIDYSTTGNYTGIETFEYTLCDNGYPTLCDVAMVTVNNPNVAPVAENDTASVLEDLPKIIDVASNDHDANGNVDLASVTIVSNPSFGTISSINPLTGEITYTGNPGASGVDSFIYNICDPGGLCDAATVFISIVSFSPDSEVDTFSIGSIIVDMGVMPQNFGNGLKPYGMVFDLIENYDIPVLWSIRNGKATGGIDFSHNGNDYRYGPFIIPVEYRSAAVDAAIASWEAQGVVVDTAVSTFTAPIAESLTGFNNIVIDQENASIVTPYFANAGIPSSYYTIGLPSTLNSCSDLFVLPHADPNWADHGWLYDFNTKHNGYIWASCHAVSMLESLRDPSDPSIQLNFLSESGLQCYDAGSCNHINEVHPDQPTQPYIFEDIRADIPVRQFIGDFSESTENGSEEWFIPMDNTNWNPGTRIIMATSDVNSAGALGTKFLFGHGFDNPDNGIVYYHAGHRLNVESTASQTAGQRAFFNFLLISTRPRPGEFRMTANVSKCIDKGESVPVGAVINNADSPPYTYTWTTTLNGTFDDPNSLNTTFNLDANANLNGNITVRITDGCDRSKFITTPINSFRSNEFPKTPSCWGAKDASIDLNVSGCEPISYLWSNGATTQDLDSLYAGTYIVQITDGRGTEHVKWILIEPTEEIYCNGPLPVEFASFTGSNIGVENHLFWTTLSEINNDHFEVQRSTDGVQFETIGQVSGTGNTADPQDYIFIDDNPYTGNNYYRLKQVDFDETYDYSQTIVLEVIELNLHNMTLWPNPTDGMAKVTLTGTLKENLYDLRIYDLTGVAVMSEEIEAYESTPFNLDLSGLHKGIYLVEIRNDYHQFSHKVIVQ